MSKKNSTTSNGKASTGFGAKKTPCNVSRSQFATQAKPVTMMVGDTPLTAMPMTFSSGSMGWNINGKVSITLADGTVVQCQAGANFTIVNSKEVPKVEAEEAA